MKKVGYENDQAGVFRRGAREKPDQRPFEGGKTILCMRFHQLSFIGH